MKTPTTQSRSDYVAKQLRLLEVETPAIPHMTDVLERDYDQRFEYKPKRTKSPSRIAWHDGKVLHVIRLGKTTNAKIAEPWMQVLQTYHFDLRQLALVRSHLDGKSKFSMKQFFDLDEACCLDCPLSNNAGDGNCYTHKVGQYKGFLSMLRSICKNDEVFYGLDAVDRASIMKMAERADYIRFGTYGEPSLLPIDLVGDIVLSKRPEVRWTGYTHQARKEWAQAYKAFFMASAHSDKDAASITGWRSFVCVDQGDTSTAVQCPASAELSLTTCAKCGLCSGVTGKGRKNIKINMH
jgi:hypothetical protein